MKDDQPFTADGRQELLSSPDPYSLLPEVSEIARRAGKKILEIYRTDFDVMMKADKSPLTEADLASQHLIANELTRVTPGLPILGEESEEIPYATRRNWKHFWLVDPLDGTKEFVKRNGEFTVNIALIDGGRPVLGVVHAPDLDLTFEAALGKGASCRRGTCLPEPICTVDPEPGSITVVTSRSHTNEATDQFLESLQKDRDVVLVAKGSALKICQVANGSAHLYPRTGPTMEWDTAAAQAIVEEAGGLIVSLENGDRLRYNKEDLLNPDFLVAYGLDAPGLPVKV
jgi:3'(2'), 5'-bisphosphate nucleotidase